MNTSESRTSGSLRGPKKRTPPSKRETLLQRIFIDPKICYDSVLVLVLLCHLLSAAAANSAGASLEPILGTKGRLLLEETFDGDALPKGWSVKSGLVRVAGGTLHTSQKKERDGRLCLFNCAQPMQDAAIQIDFKFSGRGGLNVSVNPSPGELRKHGHLFSVMIATTMWNITEHNDKSDRNSQSKALASAPETFEPGRWYTLLVENKGDEVVAQVQGKKPLRASSKDFHVKKPGIEFRVAGRDTEEVSFDNLRVWELK